MCAYFSAIVSACTELKFCLASRYLSITLSVRDGLPDVTRHSKAQSQAAFIRG